MRDYVKDYRKYCKYKETHIDLSLYRDSYYKLLESLIPDIINAKLTNRQQDCMNLYVKGKTQIDISKELDISQSTISIHISNASKIINEYIHYCLKAVQIYSGISGDILYEM